MALFFCGHSVYLLCFGRLRAAEVIMFSPCPVVQSRANMDSSAGRASPLHVYMQQRRRDMTARGLELSSLTICKNLVTKVNLCSYKYRKKV